MQSESARMSSAEEAKFRITSSNSISRKTKIIALDPASERVLETTAREKWSDTSFLTATAFSGVSANCSDTSLKGWLSDLAGRAKDLVNEVQGSDSVIMVAMTGENSDAAALISEACAIRGVLTTALVLGGRSCSDEVLSKTLSQLRPHVVMLVVSGDDDYIKDMLVALRA
jgi:hypothetical protein